MQTLTFFAAFSILLLLFGGVFIYIGFITLLITLFAGAVRSAFIQEKQSW